MYAERFLRASPRHQASASSSTSMSSTSSASAYSGVTRHPPSSSKYKRVNRSKDCQDVLSGRDVNSLDAHHGRVCHSPYVTEFLQGTPGSLCYEKGPCRSNDDDVISEDLGLCSNCVVASSLRDILYRVNQYPAPPQSTCEPPPTPPPVWSRDLAPIGLDDRCQGPSSRTARPIFNVPVPKPNVKKCRPSSSTTASVTHTKSASCRGALVGPLRVFLDWACWALGWVRLNDSRSRSRRETTTPVRHAVELPGRYESSQESESDSGCASDSWSAMWTGTEDEDEENEVEAALCTPRLPGRERKCCERGPRCFLPNQSCEEHLLELELHKCKKSPHKHRGALGHLPQRTTRSNRLVLSGHPILPHAILASPPADACRVINAPDYHEWCSTHPHSECVVDEDGDISLVSMDAYCETLLSNHRHPRWRHYRFTVESVAKEGVIEKRVPVTYLDKAMVEAEWLQDMSHVRKPQCERVLSTGKKQLAVSEAAYTKQF